MVFSFTFPMKVIQEKQIHYDNNFGTNANHCLLHPNHPILLHWKSLISSEKKHFSIEVIPMIALLLMMHEFILLTLFCVTIRASSCPIILAIENNNLSTISCMKVYVLRYCAKSIFIKTIIHLAPNSKDSHWQQRRTRIPNKLWATRPRI